MTEKQRQWRLDRRTLLETAGGCAAAALAFVAYRLGAHTPAREWEDLGNRPLQVLAHRDDTANGQRRLLIEQWNAAHPGHPAEMIELPPIADLQYSAIHSALQAENEHVDVVDLDVVWIAEFAAAGHLETLDDPDPDTRGFLERPLESGRIDGRLVALPFNTNVGMLYYRKGAESDYATGALSAKEAESIRDWDGLRGTARWILEANDAFDGGIAMQLASYEGFTVNVWEYLLANGVAVDGSTGMIDFGEDSEAVRPLEDLADDLHGEVREGATVILQDSLQFNEDDALAAFQLGRTPFLRHWPQAIRALQACDLDFEVGVVPMPGGVLGGGSLAVSAHSKRRNASRALVEFLTGPTSAQLLFERGGFAAAREEPYFDAIAQMRLGAAPEASCETGGGPRFEAEPLHDALTGEGPGRRPAVNRYTQFSRAFRDALHPQLVSNAVPDLQGLQARLDAAIEGK
ncbi:extracellular solute-binding protein [Glycomyces sp. TRM65418]|uniref:extracellular solute-binding protein n=1 Tax=Glycomyces sp. TRM65418 TaxID=2867006 RepID=UPI001CE4DCCB|nr:extracellular solute-binding protein [Glycomyces sp. TRM65418]MCC3765115.1 extracellular solute-binding protein [Glycomyces sp. TRM65418]QZD54744.1 extracellular solute-binding protein [Glycomyces sp. TRM65418]